MGGGALLRVRILTNLGSVAIGIWRIGDGAEHGLLLGGTVTSFALGINLQRLVRRRDSVVLEEGRGRRVERELLHHNVTTVNDQIILDACSLHLIILVKTVLRVEAHLRVINM
jgi:hypothetical protein